MRFYNSLKDYLEDIGIKSNSYIDIGQQETLYIIQHRDTILSDSNIAKEIPTKSSTWSEKERLTYLISDIISTEGDAKYAQYYYPIASYAYAYEPNVHSDSQFIKEHLDALPEQEEKTSLIVDGAYYSEDAEKMAAEKNIELLPTALSVKKNRRDSSGFIMDKEQKKVIECPAGNAPKSCCYKQNNDEFKITFDRETCANCPHKDKCHAKIFKNVARVLVTKKSLVRISLEKKMSGEKYNLYRRIRNGVETIPSILRRIYHLEKLPRGRLRGKFFFGNKIAALNFRKLFHYVKGSSNYAENPLLT